MCECVNEGGYGGRWEDGRRTDWIQNKKEKPYIFIWAKKIFEGLVDGTLNAEKKLLMGLWCLGLRGWGYQ